VEHESGSTQVERFDETCDRVDVQLQRMIGQFGRLARTTETGEVEGDHPVVGGESADDFPIGKALWRLAVQAKNRPPCPSSM
jgi:hypothetical protein